MAFKKKAWVDRVAEFINRRTLTKEDGSTELVTVARSEGTISKEGDAFNAETMNNLEQRIADEFNSVEEELDKKSPLNHADSSNQYGEATGEKYGHVLITDDFTVFDNAKPRPKARALSANGAFNLFATLRGQIVCEDISVTGLGYAFVYIAPKTGYKLVNVYNAGREYNEANVTNFEYDGKNNVYDIFFNIVQPTTNHILLRCIWARE